MNGFLFTFNMFFFRKYSQDMSPLLAGYILEIVNGIYVISLGVFLSSTQQYNHFKISKQEYNRILILAPLLLIAVF